MAEQETKRSHSWIWLIAGVILGAVGVWVHFQGYLNPVYHTVGLHSLMVGEAHPDPKDGGSPPPGGHAGHGGMAMPLGKGEMAKAPGYSIVTLTPERIQLIGVRWDKVKPKQKKFPMSIRAVGIIEPDQTKLALVHTRISGWVTKVHVNVIGQVVEKGDDLLEIYSPDLLATQEEYLIASNAKDESLVKSTLKRLELWGVSKEDLDALARTKKVHETLTLRAPIKGRVLDLNVLKGSQVEPTKELYRIVDLSKVWVQARVYEYELPHIEVGQKADITLLSQSEPIKGTVKFIEPVVQETTRTVKVRVEMDNPKDLKDPNQFRYKPGMYANVTIHHEMETGLLVPESAVLRTGDRDLAFRVLGKGRFEPVEVKLGSRFGDNYEVLSGLTAGEDVVISATFLIDAESRLKAAVSDFGGGHQHGSGGDKKKAPEPPAKVEEHDHSKMKH